MGNRLIALGISWTGILGIWVFSFLYIEQFSFYKNIPWLLEFFRLGYLSVGIILFFRFRSFRIHKHWENLLRSYSESTGFSPEIRVFPKGEWLPFLHYGGWMLAGVLGFVFGWPELLKQLGWGIAQILDTSIWLLAWAWIAKVSWLRAARSRETLKLSLDDLRSRRGKSGGQLKRYRPATLPIKILYGLYCLAISLLLVYGGYYRWQHREGTAAKAGISHCMEQAWVQAKKNFEKEGKSFSGDVPKCDPYSEFTAWKWVQVENGFTLSVWEKKDRDVFKDDEPGNQGLQLNAEGNFVELLRFIRKERFANP